MKQHKPTRLEFALLKVWHAWVAGGFVVAYVTADEDTYAMHLFAGYAVLAAIAVRLLAGFVAPQGSPWRLPRPDLAASLAWFSARKGRHPMFAWLAALLLGGVGLAAVSGALADVMPWLEHPHEAISEASLWIISAHIAFVFYMHGGRRLVARLAGSIGRRHVTRLSKENVR